MHAEVNHPGIEGAQPAVWTILPQSASLHEPSSNISRLIQEPPPVKRIIALFSITVIFTGCITPRQSAVMTGAGAVAKLLDPNPKLDRLAEDYFEEFLVLNPTLATSIGDNRYNDRYVASFSDQARAEEKALDVKYLAQLNRFNRKSLDDQHQITFDVFRTNLQNAIAGFAFPSNLQPLNQFANFTAGFAQMGAGTGLHPFKTVKNYDDFLSRIHGFAGAVDTAIANMRRGIAMGVVQPRILMERTVPQLEAHVVDNPETSLFYGPIRNMPTTFSPEDRARLTAAYTDAIRNEIVPSYRKLRDFVRDVYIPAARTTSGYSSLPNGRVWYQHLVRASTTTDLTPDSLHKIGLSEVARIHSEMEKVKEQVGFKGTLQEFFKYLLTDPKFRYSSREEMLADYRAAKSRIDSSTDKLFDFKPKADYEIRPVEPFRERSASGGAYQAASPDGSRPGIFYLNTYDPAGRPRFGKEDLLLHEGSPGHHFQLSVQRELTNLPRIRRYGGFTAFIEGWGLYSETLGKELEMYQDPYEYFGALSGELWRAIRLVLDTGIHWDGWTREQAMQYARDNSSQAESSIESEVERFMAIPSQALAYKTGQLKITEMRELAERVLGPRFDIKKFHHAVLENGALPLDVFEAHMDRWIAEQK